jgi:hypothetical protein
MATMTRLPVAEYAAWLRAHTAAGGAITHAYDYPYARQADRYYRANRDFRLGGECGSRAAVVLPAPGIKHIDGAIGHNIVLPEPGGACQYAAVFNDPEFDTISGVKEARKQAAEKQRRFEAECRRREQLAELERLHSDIPDRFADPR